MPSSRCDEASTNGTAASYLIAGMRFLRVQSRERCRLRSFNLMSARRNVLLLDLKVVSWTTPTFDKTADDIDTNMLASDGVYAHHMRVLDFRVLTGPARALSSLFSS